MYANVSEVSAYKSLTLKTEYWKIAYFSNAAVLTPGVFLLIV